MVLLICIAAGIQLRSLTGVRVRRVALKQDGGGSIAERTIHHIRMTSDPTNVSHTRIHISRAIVKHILKEAVRGFHK